MSIAQKLPLSRLPKVADDWASSQSKGTGGQEHEPSK
jgi:hypothetical protein